MADKESVFEVGQQWRTRHGQLVTIREISQTGNFPMTTCSHRYTRSGYYRQAGSEHAYDLIEQIVQPATNTVAEQATNTATTAETDRQIEMFNTPVLAANDMSIAGYESLADVLQRAYNQAAVGKGVERHSAAGEPFHEQVMQIGAAKFGHGALLFQAFKKSEESQRLPHDRAINELLGSIVYLAGAVIALEIKKDSM